MIPHAKLKGNSKRKLRGFTLVELLVILSILGVLLTLGVLNVNGQLMKARDAKRKAELKQYQIALEQYYEDHNSYPLHNKSLGQPGCTLPVCTVCTGQCREDNDPDRQVWSTFTSELSPYIAKLPEGPSSNSWAYYIYTTTVLNTDGFWQDQGQGYCLGTFLENPKDRDINNPSATKNGIVIPSCNMFHFGCAANYYVCERK